MMRNSGAFVEYMAEVVGQEPPTYIVEALPGETVSKKWYFKNTGKVSWPHTENLRFCVTSQSQPGLTTKQELIVNNEVTPEEIVHVDVPIYAPDKEGLHYLSFKFVYGDHLHMWFGPQVTCIIKVFIPTFPDEEIAVKPKKIKKAAPIP